MLFDKDYQAKPSYYAVVDTDSEVEKIQTMNAYQYASDADLEQAFAIQTPQTLQRLSTDGNTSTSDMTFKAAWNADGLVIRVSNLDPGLSSLSVYGSTTDQQGELLKTVTDFDGKDSMDISVPLTGKAGSIVYLDLVAESNVTAYVQKTDGTYEDVHFNYFYAWNDLDFIKQYIFDMAPIAKPTCGIVTLKAQPKSATATYGTPTIDGTIDSVWEDAPTIDVNTFSVGNGATGTAKMLWDENNLYVLTEVTDPVLSKSSANAYEQDTVEVFFDENNHKTDYYETDDLQARVNYDNEKTITDGLSTDRFVSATAKTDKGYLVEMAIPFGIAPFKNGQVLGFDVQVNDDGTGDGKRTAISNWNDLTGMGYTSTAGYGVLTLTGGSSETTTSATTTTGTSTTTTTTVTTTSTLENINYGDVNLDGVVDLADSIVLNKYLAQVLTLSDMALKNADVNTDQNLTEKDTTILMRFILQDKDYPELPHVDAE